jgi:nucleoside-diphosphate-sugar epimerase
MASVVVTGAAGFLGRLLIERLLETDHVVVQGRLVAVDRIVAVDRVIPKNWQQAERLESVESDLHTWLTVDHSVWRDDLIVYHLASAVSGECEANLDTGIEANVMTGIALGRLLASRATRPTLVFASSLAVYGGTADTPLPDSITDAVRPTPQNSYGAQKLMLETFYADLARRGLISIRTLRLMTVSVRPGQPNQAASGFLSGMIREPLQGRPSNIPVPLDLNVVLNSPEDAVSGLIQVAGFDDRTWESPLGVNLPGMMLSVGDMVDALREVGGERAVSLLSNEIDPAIHQIVSGWPARFDSTRAKRLGLTSGQSYPAVVRRFLESLT